MAFRSATPAASSASPGEHRSDAQIIQVSSEALARPRELLETTKAHLALVSPSASQPAYRAYILDRDGHIKLAHPLACETDEQAIAAAQQYVDGHTVELWDRSRKIALLPPIEPTK
jgi:hypothetical protein